CRVAAANEILRRRRSPHSAADRTTRVHSQQKELGRGLPARVLRDRRIRFPENRGGDVPYFVCFDCTSLTSATVMSCSEWMTPTSNAVGAFPAEHAHVLHGPPRPPSWLSIGCPQAHESLASCMVNLRLAPRL